MNYQLSYHQLNKRTLIIQWPQEISERILNDINQFKTAIEQDFEKIHTVVSYCELLLEFNNGIEEFGELTNKLKSIYKNKKETHYSPSLIKIPVCYDPKFGIDQKTLCDNLSIELDELIRLHTNVTYTIYAIGFLPGFMYLGGLDKRLHHPRLEHPRGSVPKGSVGIAGMQTGIYPQESPGGWQLIGRSPLELFQVNKQPPCFVEVGDKIQFHPISIKEFELIEIQLKTELFQLDKRPYHD